MLLLRIRATKPISSGARTQRRRRKNKRDANPERKKKRKYKPNRLPSDAVLALFACLPVFHSPIFSSRVWCPEFARHFHFIWSTIPCGIRHISTGCWSMCFPKKTHHYNSQLFFYITWFSYFFLKKKLLDSGFSLASFSG